MSVVFLNQTLLLQRLLRACGSLVKGLNKQDHIVTVGVCAGRTYRRQACVFLLERIKVTTKLKMAVFWVVSLCSLVEVYRRFRRACCLHHQGDHFFYGGSKHLGNTGKLLPDYVAQQHRRLTNHKWTRANYQLRHVLTRLAVHGFSPQDLRH
jgi:hypothetical protein